MNPATTWAAPVPGLPGCWRVRTPPSGDDGADCLDAETPPCSSVATRSMTPLTLPRLPDDTDDEAGAPGSAHTRVIRPSLRVWVCKDRAANHEKFMHAAGEAGGPGTTL